MGTAATARVDFLAELWRGFAEREAGPYSPLYAAIARSVADDRRLLERVIEDVPPSGHLPISLLAAVHDVVLREPALALGTAYVDHDARVAPRLFAELCRAEWASIVGTLQHRRVQTNECGRSAPIAVALARVTDAVGPLAALIDTGASAGLNLLYDRYHLDYGTLGRLGDPESPVHVVCTVTGPGAGVRLHLPAVSQRLGIDRQPVDVSCEDDRRWLLACVWPDTGRLERTAAALEIATAHPPDVRRGDMVADLPATIDALDVDGPVCVMTSWAASYLSLEERARFVVGLDESGRVRTVVWLSLEAAGVVGLFEAPRERAGFGVEPSVVGVALFRNGTRRARAVGLVHPHGWALRWLS